MEEGLSRRLFICKKDSLHYLVDKAGKEINVKYKVGWSVIGG